MATGTITGSCTNQYISTWIEYVTTETNVQAILYAKKSSVSTSPTWGTCYGNITIDGIVTDFSQSVTLNNNNSTVQLASASVNVSNKSNIEISFNWAIQGTTAYDASGSGQATMEQLAVNITNFRIVAKTLNSLTLAYSTDAEVDAVRYYIKTWGWWLDLPASKIVGGLSPNADYQIKIQVRRKGTNVWSESGYVEARTYDIARITELNNFNFGDNLLIKSSNESKQWNGIRMLIGEDVIVNKDKANDNWNYEFLQQELDAIYKHFNSNTLQITVEVITKYENNTWTDTKTVTCILTGNAKTVYKRVNGEWKRGKMWRKVNGNWVRGVAWKKINNEWRRCI